MLLNFFIISAILSVIIILVWKILSKINFFKERKTLKITATVIGSIVLYYISALIFFSALFYERDIDFNETVWKNEFRVRSKMIEDLVHSDYLIDKKTSKIREVFGIPLKADSTKNTLTYELMGKHGLGIKVTYLTLHLNDSVVKSYEHNTVYDD